MWNDTYWQLEAANTPWAAAFSDMEQKKNLVHVFTVELIAFTTLQGFNNVNKKNKSIRKIYQGSEKYLIDKSFSVVFSCTLKYMHALILH